MWAVANAARRWSKFRDEVNGVAILV
jgi:hypothetical protein